MAYFTIQDTDSPDIKEAKELLNQVRDFETLISIYNGTCGSGYDEFYTKDLLMEMLRILDGQEGFDTFEMLADADVTSDGYYYISVYHTIEETSKEIILDEMNDETTLELMAEEAQYYI